MILRLGTVYDNVDPHGGGLIRVKLIEDESKRSDELPFCMPLLPKNLHIHPKVGELVAVLANDKNELYGNHTRWFVGPIITQLDKLKYQDSRSAKSFFKDGFFNPGTNPFNYKGSEGVYPEKGNIAEEFGNNIAILGRHNEDIILKEDEIWIRSGVHKKEDDGLVFDQPAYIKQKGYKSPQSYTNTNDVFRNRTTKKMTYRTTTTIVADEINLISSSKDISNQPNPLNLYNTEHLVDDETMNKILETCHRLPFGDVLIEFLSAFKQAFLTHVHIQGNAQMVPDPILSQFPQEFTSVDFNKMISNNVRIN